MPQSNAFSATIHAIGRRRDVFGDFYHFVLELPWTLFLTLSGLVFLGINTLFAFLYSLQEGSISGIKSDAFIHEFFFSVQTMSTIGYGGMTPQTVYADILVTIEAALGLVYTALVTGLVFARLARPRARVLFSDKMIVAPRNGVPHLMFRMANWRHNVIVEARLKAYILCRERTREGEELMRPVPLELVRSENAFFWMSWVAMHPIDKDSPLYGKGQLERLMDEGSIIMLSLAGTDETVAQVVHAGYRYTMDDIYVGYLFKDIMNRPSMDYVEINYHEFHKIRPIERRWWTPELEDMRACLGERPDAPRVVEAQASSE